MHRKPVNSASEKTPKDGTCSVVATPGRPAGSKSCASSVSRMFLPPWKMNPRRCEFASPARGLDWMHFRHSPAGPSVGAGVGFSFSQGEKTAARGAGAGSVAPTSNAGHRVTFSAKNNSAGEDRRVEVQRAHLHQPPPWRPGFQNAAMVHERQGHTAPPLILTLFQPLNLFM
jgi:hypothetical protein